MAKKKKLAHEFSYYLFCHGDFSAMVSTKLSRLAEVTMHYVTWARISRQKGT